MFETANVYLLAFVFGVTSFISVLIFYLTSYFARDNDLDKEISKVVSRKKKSDTSASKKEKIKKVKGRPKKKEDEAISTEQSTDDALEDSDGLPNDSKARKRPKKVLILAGDEKENLSSEIESSDASPAVAPIAKSKKKHRAVLSESQSQSPVSNVSFNSPAPPSEPLSNQESQASPSSASKSKKAKKKRSVEEVAVAEVVVANVAQVQSAVKPTTAQSPTFVAAPHPPTEQLHIDDTGLDTGDKKKKRKKKSGGGISPPLSPKVATDHSAFPPPVALASSPPIGSSQAANQVTKDNQILEETRRRLAEVMTQSDRLRSEIAEERRAQSAAISAKVKEIGAVQQQLTHSRVTNQRLQEEVARLTASQAEMDKRCQILQSEFAGNLQRFDVSQREKIQLEKRYALLEDKLQRLEATPPAPPTPSPQQTAAAVALVEEKLRATEASLAISRQEVEAAGRSRQEQDDSVKELLRDKSLQQQQAARLESELVAMQGRCHARETECQSLRIELNKAMKAAAAGMTAPSLNQHQQHRQATPPPDGKQSETLLKEKETRISGLQNELTKLNQEIENQRKKNSQLEERLTQSNAAAAAAATGSHDSTEKLAAVQKENETLKREKERLSQVTRQLYEVTQRAEKSEAELAQLLQKFEGKEKLNVELQAQLNEKSAESATAKKNSELVQEMGRLNEANKRLSEQVSSLQQSHTSIQATVEDRDRQLAQIRHQLEEKGKTNADTEKRWNEERQTLSSQLAHYKQVLEDTERILSGLQKSVDDEEGKWRQALEASERECDKARGELHRVYCELRRLQGNTEDVSDINFAYQCVEKSLPSIINEMEARVKDLETRLETVTKERDAAVDEASGLRVQVTNSKTQEPPCKLGNGTNDTSPAVVGEELARLQAELDEERRNKKTLSQQNTKLNSLVKIGENALREEQQVVARLKEQLVVTASVLPQ